MRGGLLIGRGGASARGLATLAATTAFGLVSVAAADAGIWYAEPDGDGVDPCLAADPCAIEDALGNAPPGSKIAALAGTYVAGAAGLDVEGGRTLQGPWSGPPAVVVGDGTAGPAVSARGVGTRVTDLSIGQSGSGVGIEIGAGALGDRLKATTSGSVAACTPVIGGLLRDSVCAAYGGGGNGLLIDEDTAVSGAAEITNVTVVSGGNGSTSGPLLVRASGGAEIDVTATNVIAHSLGAAPEVAVGALIGGSSADVDLANSNYDTPAIVGADATVTPAGTNGNQTAEPAFTDLEAGDLSEAPDSPTIDAGTAGVASLGLLDLSRNARIGGPEPDIGAFEYVPPPDSRAPNVAIVSAPKGKLKTRGRFVDVTFELASDEEDVVFECRIDRLPVEQCTSPVSYRLKATKGVGTTYLLTVRATDAAGNRSGKAIRQVQVIRKPKD